MSNTILGSLLKLYLALSPLIAGGLTPSVSLDPIRVNAALMGPFYAGEEASIKFQVTSDKSFRDQCFSICGTQKSDWSATFGQYGVSSLIYDVESGDKITVNLQLSSSFTGHRMSHCKIMMYNYFTNVVNWDVAFDLYVIPPGGGGYVLNPFEIKNKEYLVENSCFKIINNKVTYSGETFRFYNYVDYFMVDEYYRLKLDQFKTKFHFLSGFVYHNAYIELINPQPCFSSLINKKGEAIIPLELYSPDEQYFYIDFACDLYVEPKSFYMSTSPKIGYKQTHYFYMPINKKEEAMKQEFRFHLEGLGDLETDVVFSCYYSNDINLIGDCFNSKYCVVGGNKK